MDKNGMLSEYAGILACFFQGREEESFFKVSELGKRMVAERLGPDILLDVHSRAVKEAVADRDAQEMARMLVSANDVLLNGIMAYAMNYYSFMDLLDAERARLQEAKKDLETQRHTLDTIVSGIDADLMLLGPDLQVLWMNQALKDRSLFRLDDRTPTHCYQAYCGLEAPPKDCPALRTFRTGRPVTTERAVVAPDGRVRYALFSCSPIRDARGEVIRVLELVLDVTAHKKAQRDLEAQAAELQRANAALRQLDRLKSLFIASMSHELRTPLNSIIGFTGVILQGLSGPLNEEQRDQLGRVYRAARHLVSLITDLIDVSKIEAGQVEAHVTRFGLEDLVEEALTMVREKAASKGLKLAADIPPGLTLATDRRRLLQCLLNYLGNAVNYTEEGTVRVEATPEDGHVRLQVHDTGPGIAEDDLARLFEPFMRGRPRAGGKPGGTGLGLYLTRKIAREILGGTVTVRSEPGRGSTFGLLIPVNREAAGAEAMKRP